MVSRATEAIGLLVSNAVSAADIFEGAHHVKAPTLKREDNVESGDDLQAHFGEPTEGISSVEDYESWHVPAADRPISKSAKKQKDHQYAEVDLGNGQKGRMKI